VFTLCLLLSFVALRKCVAFILKRGEGGRERERKSRARGRRVEVIAGLHKGRQTQ
jgi:hypothetical protein